VHGASSPTPYSQIAFMSTINQQKLEVVLHNTVHSRRVASRVHNAAS